MRKLDRTLLEGTFVSAPGLEAGPFPSGMPERVIQFGEGNFLRAFVDWMFHQLNRKGLWEGRVVVVQPLAQGLVDKLNRQDGLYTLLLRGLVDDRRVERREIISSVSRGINPYTDWPAVLACAADPAIEFVVSNTTEAGIVYDPEDRVTDTPPRSFPGKLTVYLYHRFRRFDGDPARGLTIMPCELIDRNGDRLKDVVLRLSREWGLSREFSRWLLEANLFLNTLVDRVVPGYPGEESEQLTRELGYSDELLDVGELFHLWVIEGPAQLAEKLPFRQAGLNVIWTDDMAPYRTRKVRILNGAHTATASLAFLSGIDTVQEAVESLVIGRFMRDAVYGEIIPSLDLDRTVLTEFAGQVLERFRNPAIVHHWQSILLNTTSKYKTRVLPSLLDYAVRKKACPPRLTFALAATAVLFKDGRVNGRHFTGRRGQEDFVLEDDPQALGFWQKVWRGYRTQADGTGEVAASILDGADVWGENLNSVPGLSELLGKYLQAILTRGMEKALALVTAGESL